MPQQVLKKGSIPSIRLVDTTTLEAVKVGLQKPEEDKSRSNVCKTKRRLNHGKICFFCKAATIPGSSFFEFPKNERRPLWIKACGLGDDIPANARLCGQHFERHHFAKLPGTYGRAYLEKTAIPTIFHNNNGCDGAITNRNSEMVKSSEGTISSSVIQDMELDPLATPEVTSMCRLVVKSEPCDLSSVPSNLYSGNHNLPTEITDKNLQGVREPRYVGDITLAHMNCKETAIRSYQLMKSTITKQNKKIKILQNRLRRRNMRISNLLDELQVMREKI